MITHAALLMTALVLAESYGTPAPYNPFNQPAYQPPQPTYQAPAYHPPPAPVYGAAAATNTYTPPPTQTYTPATTYTQTPWTTQTTTPAPTQTLTTVTVTPMITYTTTPGLTTTVTVTPYVALDQYGHAPTTLFPPFKLPTFAPYVAPTLAPYVAPTLAPYVAPTLAPYAKLYADAKHSASVKESASRTTKQSVLPLLIAAVMMGVVGLAALKIRNMFGQVRETRAFFQPLSNEDHDDDLE